MCCWLRCVHFCLRHCISVFRKGGVACVLRLPCSAFAFAPSRSMPSPRLVGLLLAVPFCSFVLRVRCCGLFCFSLRASCDLFVLLVGVQPLSLVRGPKFLFTPVMPDQGYLRGPFKTRRVNHHHHHHHYHHHLPRTRGRAS